MTALPPAGRWGRLLALAMLLAAPLMAQDGAAAVEPSRHKLFPIDPTAYLLGHFRPDTTPDFVGLSRRLSGGRPAYLRRSAAAAVVALMQAAAGDGVELEVISATRSFGEQRTIWEGKFTGERLAGGRNLAEEYPDTTERCRAILEYSSAPGLSRHHWGTDVDFNSTSSAYWRAGPGAKAVEWLKAHAAGFGFVMAYPPGRDQGYSYEPWHWSYQALARPLLRNYHRRLVAADDIAGFMGAEAVRRLAWRESYVYGVNEVLK